MLCDTVGPTLLATLPAGDFIETTSMHVMFLARAHTGRLVGRGRIVRRDGGQAAPHRLRRHVVATAAATAVVTYSARCCTYTT